MAAELEAELAGALEEEESQIQEMVAGKSADDIRQIVRGEWRQRFGFFVSTGAMVAKEAVYDVGRENLQVGGHCCC